MGGLTPVRRLRVWFLPLLLVLFLGHSRWPLSTGEADLPQRVALLWIEELNTHLLGPNTSGLMVEPVILNREDKFIRSNVDRHLAGNDPQVLVVYRLYDYDDLAAVRVELVAASRLPHPVRIPSAPAAGPRPGPRQLIVQAIKPDGSIVVSVDEQPVSLSSGQMWAQGRVNGQTKPLTIYDDGQGITPAAVAARESIEDAMDQGRAVTILRLRNLGWWNLLPRGGAA